MFSSCSSPSYLSQDKSYCHFQPYSPAATSPDEPLIASYRNVATEQATTPRLNPPPHCTLTKLRRDGFWEPGLVTASNGFVGFVRVAGSHQRQENQCVLVDSCTCRDCRDEEQMSWACCRLQEPFEVSEYFKARRYMKQGTYT